VTGTGVLALVADLFFSARIRETARQLGVPCEVVKDAPAFVARARELRPDLCIVDMNLKTGDAAAAVRELRAASPKLPIVGYLHDVQESLMDDAAVAGCSLVLSRGRLTRRLADLVSGKVEFA
jgi:DNA-binding NarL/FixJ family response regulator